MDHREQKNPKMQYMIHQFENAVYEKKNMEGDIHDKSETYGKGNKRMLVVIQTTVVLCRNALCSICGF